MVMTMLMAFTFTSCGDDDDDAVNYYSAGFGSIQASLPLQSDVIEAAFVAAFKTTLGQSSSSFTLTGNTSACDAKVKAACAAAELALSAVSFNGSYQYVVTRDGTTIYDHTFK
jgi:hypothetical protein